METQRSVKRSRNEDLLRSAIIRDTSTMREAFESLDTSGVQVVLIVDREEQTVGLATDGDLRRALLRGVTLEDPVAPHMRTEFKWVPPEAQRDDVLDVMQALRISEIPILDESRRAIGLHLLHDVVRHTSRENWAVVMAGGRGVRLAPLTDTIPKPMIRVAGRPILERIVLQLVGAGFSKIFLAVHYLGHIIEEHFGDGANFGCTIEYLRETQPLGTAGALRLLPEPPSRSILLMNGDLMTQAHLGSLVDFHESHHHVATVAVRQYVHEVPFGCLDLDGSRVTSLVEKPALQRVVNAGIYALSPTFLKHVDRESPVTMPELLTRCIGRGEHVGAWEIEDDWIDVGQRAELDRARGER